MYLVVWVDAAVESALERFIPELLGKSANAGGIRWKAVLGLKGLRSESARPPSVYLPKLRFP